MNLKRDSSKKLKFIDRQAKLAQRINDLKKVKN